MRRMNQLKREVKKCLHGEKENKDNQLHKNMLHFKTEFLLPLFRLYRRLNAQEFVRFTDEEKFFKMLDQALYLFKDLINYYSVPPEAPTSAPLTEV